jgi:hypothetical protein
MKTISRSHLGLIFLAVVLMLAACSRHKEQSQPDHPRLASKVARQDIIFHRAALDRDMQYRFILPVSIHPSQKLPLYTCFTVEEVVFVIGRTIRMSPALPNLASYLLCQKATNPTTQTPRQDQKTVMKTTLLKT